MFYEPNDQIIKIFNDMDDIKEHLNTHAAELISDKKFGQAAGIQYTVELYNQKINQMKMVFSLL